jgi:hypothetical protein
VTASRGDRTFVGIAVLTALAVGGALVWRGRTPPSAASNVADARLGEREDDVAVLPVVRGEVGATLFFVAGWRNGSGEVHTVSDIVASLVDGARVEVARVVAPPLLRVLEPGEETWALLVVDPAPPHDVERVTAVEAARPGRQVDEVRMFVDDVIVSDEVVRARVHHDAAGPVRLTRLVALGFGADGRACAWSEVPSPPATPLQPGQNLAVEVPLGPFRACPEPSWTLRAVGEAVL